MSFINRFSLYFLLAASLSIAILLYIISSLSISYKEALFFFENKAFMAKLANLSVQHFGLNDYSFRLPQLTFHFLNLCLIYLISNKILKYKRDSILCVLIYALIPGVIMQGSILNESIAVLCLVLLICYIELINKKIAYPLLIIAIFISPSAFMLFLALLFYAIARRKTKTIIFALICFGLNLYIYGIDIGGHPSGRFIDVFGELALLYSPPLFIYYTYTLYRTLTKGEANLLLYVSVTSLIVSILLSIRQEVDKEIFLFMSLCGIPLMIKQFLSDIRIRLPMFQNAYKNRFIIVIVFLVFEAGLLIFSKSTYIFFKDKEDSFLNQFYIAKEVAISLKEKNISKVSIDDYKMRERLRFYGIDEGGQRLREVKRGGNIIVTYNGEVIARYAI